jgi:AcrR family transcriptional regulator
MPAMPVNPTEPRRSAARERLLEAASAVFYAEGVHAVGVDRLIAEAGVTRATFYRHFPSKEDLVVAYVLRWDRGLRDRAAGAADEAPEPAAQLRAIVDAVAEGLVGPGFRGCPFINIAAEYPDADGPVRRAIDDHRVWFHNTLVTLLTASGHGAPVFAADLLMMLRDGGHAGAYLGDAGLVRETFLRAADGVLG